VQGARWTTDIDTYYRSLDFDVGIAPLRPIGFNKAKSPLKALEFAALGIPIVASDWGPYSEFVCHGETGFLVPYGQDHLWRRYLSALIEDEVLRIEMGEAAREHATGCTIQEHGGRWAEALRR
jgi:glycosyltransferase involved in cell wall biosynthesis